MDQRSGFLSKDGSFKMGIMGRQRTISLLIVCAITCLCFGIYANSLKNNFVNWDDPGLILKNNRIRSLGLENIREMFTLKKSSTFQPIRVLSYAIDYRIWEFNPMGYRLTNILLYILTCIMVFYCLKLVSVTLRGKKNADSHFRVGLFGALLFAAHPVHVEAVTWLSARKEVLQGFFFFLAFYFYLKGREGKTSKKAVYLSTVLPFFLLAVLSKNSAVVFPAGLILYELTRGREKFVSFLKDHWVFIVVALVVSGIFTFILMKVMIEAGGIKPYYGDSLLKNILVCIYAFLRNIKLLIATINYSAAYSFAVTLPIFHIKNIVFTSIVIFLFGLCIFSLRWTKVIFFSFFFFFITILPYLNIIPISTLLADRYVFIASFSYVFLLGILFDRLYNYKYKGFSTGFFKLLSVSLFLFILTAYSYMTIQQNKIWENNYTLWADAIEKSPNSNTANAMMGIVYMDLGMNEKAVKYLEKAVKILPYDYQSRNNLSIVYGRMEQPEKAFKELMTAIWLKPDDDTIKINLSAFYQKQKEYKKAEGILKSLLSKSSNNADLHFRLGMLYKETGQYEAAVKELLKSMELAPHIISPYEELGNIYASKFQDLEKAKYYYSKGIEGVPEAKSRIEDLRGMIQGLETHR